MNFCIFLRLWTIYLILQSSTAYLPKPHGIPPPMGFIRVPTKLHPSQMIPKNPILLQLPFTPPTSLIPVQPATSKADTTTPVTTTLYQKLNDVFVTTLKPRRSTIGIKNDIEEYVAEMTAEKEHERKLADILPLVTFDCHQRTEGYYADIDFNCDVFHYCGKPDGKRFTFFCPPGSRFNQIHMICDYAMFQGCENSEDYFHLNDNIYPSNDNATTSRVVTSIPHHTTAVTKKPTTTTTTTTTYKPQQQQQLQPLLKPVLNPLITLNPKLQLSPKRRWTSHPAHRRPVIPPLPFPSKLQALGSHMPPPQMLLHPHMMPRLNGKTNKHHQPSKIPPHIAAAIHQLTSRNFGNKPHQHVPPTRFVPDFHDGLPLPPFGIESRRHNRYERPDFLHSREFRRRPHFPPREFLDDYPEALARVDLNARRRAGMRNRKPWRSDDDELSTEFDGDEEEYADRMDFDEDSMNNRRDYGERNVKGENRRRHSYEKRNERVYKKTTTPPAVESSEEVVVTTTTVAPRKSKPRRHKNHNKNVRRKIISTTTTTMAAIKAAVEDTIRAEKLTSKASYRVTSPRSVDKVTSNSRRLSRKRVHNSNSGGRMNARKTTTTSSTTTTTTTEKIPEETTMSATTEIVEKLEKSTIASRKLKHRKSKYHHSRYKTSTLPSTTSLPTSTSSTTSSYTSTSTSTEALKPTVEALVSNIGEETVVNERSYV